MAFLCFLSSADFFYKCDEYYCPEAETVIRWDDPDLGIEWGMREPTISARDKAGLRLADITPGFVVN